MKLHKKDNHYFSERAGQSHLDKGFYCAEKALCATLCSHNHTFHMQGSPPLRCSGKASFAHYYGAVQWKQFLISGAEPNYLPPLIQEKDTELQTVSIPDILFPAPKLLYPFLKKWKPQYSSKVLAFQHHRNLPQGNSQKATMKHLSPSASEGNNSDFCWSCGRQVRTEPCTKHMPLGYCLRWERILHQGEGVSALSDYHSITFSFTPSPQETPGKLLQVI